MNDLPVIVRVAIYALAFLILAGTAILTGVLLAALGFTPAGGGLLAAIVVVAVLVIARRR